MLASRKGFRPSHKELWWINKPPQYLPCLSRNWIHLQLLNFPDNICRVWEDLPKQCLQSNCESLFLFSLTRWIWILLQYELHKYQDEPLQTLLLQAGVMIAAVTFVPFWQCSPDPCFKKKDLLVSGQLGIKKKDRQAWKQPVNRGWIQGNQRQSLAGRVGEGRVDRVVAQAGKPGQFCCLPSGSSCLQVPLIWDFV